MGREFEIKYAANEADLEFLKGRFPGLSPIQMQTTYYDTPGKALSRLRWTLRRRMENSVSVCTLKTPAEGFGRNEWEVECDDLHDAVALLIQKGAPKELLEFWASGGFVESCGAKFTRFAGMVEHNGTKLELALDRGLLTGGGKELPFCEVEIELKEGREEDALAFAETIAASRNLKIEPRSKVARASALADH